MVSRATLPPGEFPLETGGGYLFIGGLGNFIKKQKQARNIIKLLHFLFDWKGNICLRVQSNLTEREIRAIPVFVSFFTRIPQSNQIKV